MRRRTAKKHRILPDPRFNDIQVTKFVNNLMMHGKKELAFDIFYTAMGIIESKIEDEAPLEVFKKGLKNITPDVEVRSRRVGGATYQIPSPIREGRKESLGMKWLISFSRKRNENTMGQKLASEIMAAYKEEGGAFKKKEDTLRMAEANKAFSHFRF
ncbi:MAG: 30S ribosomal protein S7 [Flavobacteriales bacterium]